MIKEVIFMRNGNTAVFDEDGEQIPELQESWFLKYIDFLKKGGINPGFIEKINFVFPDMRVAEYLKDVNNWKFNDEHPH